MVGPGFDLMGMIDGNWHPDSINEMAISDTHDWTTLFMMSPYL